LTPALVQHFNRQVLDGLDLPPEVEPGEVRHHSVTVGPYRRPDWERCEDLVQQMCDWFNGPSFSGDGAMRIPVAERMDPCEIQQVPLRRGPPIFVADRLWRLPIRDAFAEVTLPLELNCAQPSATFRLTDRRGRSRCYEVVLREGTPADILRYIDGALLIDLWPYLVVPRQARGAMAAFDRRGHWMSSSSASSEGVASRLSAATWRTLPAATSRAGIGRASP